MKTFSFVTNSYEETEKLGEKLGKLLTRNSFVLMSGDLGAGKTAMTRGILRNFTDKDIVSSPTFALMNIYDGKLNGKTINIVHCDAYRLNSVDDLDDLGFFDFAEDNISIIEWADVVFDMPVLKDGYFNVVIKRMDEISIDQRTITMTCDDTGGELLENIVY